MYGTTAKFKSGNIFISAARDQTAKFKDHQYFLLYGKNLNTFHLLTWYGMIWSYSIMALV